MEQNPETMCANSVLRYFHGFQGLKSELIDRARTASKRKVKNFPSRRLWRHSFSNHSIMRLSNLTKTAWRRSRKLLSRVLHSIQSFNCGEQFLALSSTWQSYRAFWLIRGQWIRKLEIGRRRNERVVPHVQRFQMWR